MVLRNCLRRPFQHHPAWRHKHGRVPSTVCALFFSVQNRKQNAVFFKKSEKLERKQLEFEFVRWFSRSYPGDLDFVKLLGLALEHWASMLSPSLSQNTAPQLQIQSVGVTDVGFANDHQTTTMAVCQEFPSMLLCYCFSKHSDIRNIQRKIQPVLNENESSSSVPRSCLTRAALFASLEIMFDLRSCCWSPRVNQKSNCSQLQKWCDFNV